LRFLSHSPVLTAGRVNALGNSSLISTPISHIASITA
jgi:hypothetical protein